MEPKLKESKEILLAIAYVGVKAIEAYKAADADGKVDFQDIGVAFNFLIDPNLKLKIEGAIAGANLVGEEAKAAGFFDIVAALVEVQPEIEKLVAEIKSLKSV